MRLPHPGDSCAISLYLAAAGEQMMQQAENTATLAKTLLRFCRKFIFDGFGGAVGIQSNQYGGLLLSKK